MGSDQMGGEHLNHYRFLLKNHFIIPANPYLVFHNEFLLNAFKYILLLAQHFSSKSHLFSISFGFMQKQNGGQKNLRPDKQFILAKSFYVTFSLKSFMHVGGLEE
jgi:hypothetical protein